MDEYNLEPGELVIMQEQSVKLGDGPDGEDLEELVLTNQNLILVASVQQGLFKRSRMLKRCPLSKIRRQGDVPQVFASKYRDTYCLQIAFADETIALHFPANPKRGAERWAEGIAGATDGSFGSGSAVDLPPRDHQRCGRRTGLRGRPLWRGQGQEGRLAREARHERDQKVRGLSRPAHGPHRLDRNVSVL